jgi:hypothetical protein
MEKIKKKKEKGIMIKKAKKNLEKIYNGFF